MFLKMAGAPTPLFLREGARESLLVRPACCLQEWPGWRVRGRQADVLVLRHAAQLEGWVKTTEPQEHPLVPKEPPQRKAGSAPHLEGSCRTVLRAKR